MRHDLISQQVTPNSYLVEQWWNSLNFVQQSNFKNIYYPYIKSVNSLSFNNKVYMYNITQK